MKKLQYLISLLLVVTCLSFSSKNLKNDPKLISGKLDNGFSYLIYKNKQPENRVDLNMLVKVGSYYENDNEEGIAHFLEHMVFNGTTHFKPDELVKYFQSIGMSYGADANAYTSFFRTVYKVFLPDDDEKSLEKGLLILYDYVNEALLLDEEIQKEAKVVLAEKTARDSISYRQYVSYLKFFLQNKRLANRLPIGKEDDIKSFNSTSFKTFYNNWYRPDKMVLVAVGDFDERKIEKLIKARFSKIEKRENIPPEPPLTVLNHSGIKPYYFYDKEAKDVNVTIEVVKSLSEEKDSFEKRVREIKETIATLIMQERLDIRKQEISAPFFSASFYTSTYFKNIKNSSISAIAPPYNWIDTLVEIETTLRRALKFGFTEKEFLRAKAKLLASLEDKMQKESGRDSREIAENLVDVAFNESYFMSPTDEFNIFSKVINKLTLKDVDASFKKLFEGNHRIVSVVGNSEEEYKGKKGQEKILDIYKKSVAIPVYEKKSQQDFTFPYLKPSRSKKKISFKVQELENIGTKVVKFSNGITLNLKKTDFKENEILFSLAFGKGVSTLPVDKDGLPFISEVMFQTNGFGRLDVTNLNDILHKNNTSLDLNINDDSFVLSGATLKGKLKFVFDILYTYLSDTKYTENQYKFAQKRVRQIYPNFLNTIEGLIQVKADRVLASNDNRFGMPENYGVIRKLTFKDFEAWYINAIKNSNFEISIVGDFDEKEAIKLVLNYFSDFKTKKEFSQTRSEPTFKGEGTTTFRLKTRIPKTLIRFAYPIKLALLNKKNEIDIKKIRRLSTLAMTIDEFLREELRENIGLTYSPYTYFSYDYAYPNYSMIVLEIKTSRDNKFRVIRETKKIIKKLNENGTDNKRIALILNPVLTHIKDIKKDNRYWLKSVLENSFQFEEKFEWALDMFEDYESINAKEINELLKKQMRNENLHIVVSQPL